MIQCKRRPVTPPPQPALFREWHSFKYCEFQPTPARIQPAYYWLSQMFKGAVVQSAPAPEPPPRGSGKTLPPRPQRHYATRSVRRRSISRRGFQIRTKIRYWLQYTST
jgi:hypothetical protein